MRMDGLYSALQNPAAAQTAKPPEDSVAQPVRYRKVLHMVENERMGGKVPVWKTERADTIKDTARGFETALNGALNGEDQTITDAALAYNPVESEASINDKPFGFGDLIDIANPLHHIPVVNYAYRGITGDQIRPIGQIVGGAIYGGPIGAAGGVINVAIKEETGKDIGEHAVSMAFSGRTATHAKPAAAEELPASLLAYTAPEQPRTQSYSSEKAHKPASERTQYPELAQADGYKREPITELLLSPQKQSL